MLGRAWTNSRSLRKTLVIIMTLDEAINSKRECFRCGTSKGTIIKHHLSYNPEVIVDCCMSCHTTIHKRIRKENSCRLSVEETDKLSQKSSKIRYAKKALREIHFNECLGDNIKIHETLRYNVLNGNIYWYSYFQENSHGDLKHIDEL